MAMLPEEETPFLNVIDEEFDDTDFNSTNNISRLQFTWQEVILTTIFCSLISVTVVSIFQIYTQLCKYEGVANYTRKYDGPNFEIYQIALVTRETKKNLTFSKSY